MSSVGSFGTFTTARLAIYVSQKGLSVTGNNIANINTVGYTRQRLDQVSFKTGMADRYQNPFDKHVGNGAIAQSVSQLRDPYLDIRYRAEHSSEGYYNGRLEGLDDIAAILDEIGEGKNDGDGLLNAQFQEFFSALQKIQVDRGHEVSDTLAQTSADALCKLFYNAASQLERLKNNTETQLRQELNGINDLLINIRNLNESIQEAEIYGDGALELRDTRNNLIDELSEKVKIEATYSAVDIGGKQVEKLTIRLGNSNPDKDVNSDSSILVDGNYCAQLTAPKVNDAYNALYDKTSDAYQKALEGFNQVPPVPVQDADGNPITTKEALDAAIEAAAKDPDKQMLQFRYLDPNGEGTNDPRVADQVFDDNYNITVSDLRNKKNEEWVYYPDVRDTYVKAPLLDQLPTRAKYTGQFSFSGVWKDGDKINISVDGTNYSVEVGKDVTADAANEDPKNLSNAIRKKLMDEGALKGYDITTQTTREKKADGTYDFNVKFTVKAQDPEKKAEPLPDITISADAQKLNDGSVTIGTPTQATDKDNKPIDGRYLAEVTSGDPNKFNTGDTITIGTGTDTITLTVGKDLSVNAANDPARLAAKLAGKMKINGYTVSSTTDADGKAYLVFQGAQGAAAPTVPTVTPTAAEPVDFTPLADLDGGWANGKDGTIPNDPPKIVDNGDNTTSKVITSYFLDDNDKWHEVVKTITTSKTKMLDDNDLYGELQAIRELMTEEGEFASQADINMDESAAIKRGIPYYQEALDLLARQFATVMNEANTGFAVDESGNYLTSADGGETFEKLELAGAPLNKTTGLTDDQKAAVEADALGNYVKANFAGFVKDAAGNPTNVLADKYGNPLKLGGMELTKDMLEVDGAEWNTSVIKDAVGTNEQGQFVDANGNVIMMEDPANPPATIPADFSKIEFKTNAFLNAKDPANPTQGELDAAAAAEKAATADLNEQALDSYLAANGGYKMGGNLFSNRGDTDDGSGITALNISVSQSWNKGDIHVVPTYIKLFGGDTNNTTQQDNALHMGSLMNKKLVYNPQDLTEDAVSSHLFYGSFSEMFEKMSTTLGEDQSTTKISLTTHMGQALDIDTSRDSVSAVDLNDEAMNLMQYTHSLNAAYRLMTTIDDMIERLITGTGVTR